MIRCQEVATVLSSGTVNGLSWRDRLAVRIHLAVCVPCRRFRRQLLFLRRAAAALGSRYEEELASDFADRLHDRLTH